MEGESFLPARRSRRFPTTIPLKLMLEGEHPEQGHGARSLDLSIMGAQIETALELSTGEMLQVVAWEDYGHPIPSRVVWVQRMPPDKSLAGLEFLETPQA